MDQKIWESMVQSAENRQRESMGPNVNNLRAMDNGILWASERLKRLEKHIKLIQDIEL